MSSKERKALFSSVEQLKGKAMLSELGADLNATIMTVSRQNLSALGTLHALAEQGVRAAESSASELARASDEIAESMVRLEWQVNDTREAMTAIGARFEWGMSELLASVGGMADSLTQLVGLATTPAQTAAYEQFEIARDAFRRRLYPECLEALERAIDGDSNNPGYRLEWRFHMLRGVVRLGELPQIDPELVDRDEAHDSFGSAARYAETDEPKEAARALLAASRAAFVSSNVERAIERVEQAIQIAPDLAESHYSAAKYKVSQQPFEAAIPSLRAAIESDPMYLLKVASDPAFQDHEDALDDFLLSVRDERLAQLSPVVERAVDKLARWASRSSGFRESEAWQRLQAVVAGAKGWGFFDLHRYENDNLQADIEKLRSFAASLEDLEAKLRSAWASIEDEAARINAIAAHPIVTRWRDMLDVGGLDLQYGENVDDDLRQLRKLASQLDELEAQVQDAHAHFKRVGEHSERIQQHPTMQRWKEMIESRKWTQSYCAEFDRDRAGLAELIEQLGEYTVETTTTQVEQTVTEVIEEGRWLFKRKSTRQVRRLVDVERTLLVNGLGDQFPGPEMIEIPAATFTIGPGDEPCAGVHERDAVVRLSRAFLMAARPVTQQLWEAVMGDNPSPHKGIFRPAHGISWHEAVAFCNAMSELYGLQRAYDVQDSMLGLHVTWRGLQCDGFRLPTAAEWERACRAGSDEQRNGELSAIAWHEGNSDGHPHPVGRKKPNAWGLYDMLGNVENWCWDYATSDDDVGHRNEVDGVEVDPTGPDRGTHRVSCGDAFSTGEMRQVTPEKYERRFRASARTIRPPLESPPECGLRLVRSVGGGA